MRDRTGDHSELGFRGLLIQAFLLWLGRQTEHDLPDDHEMWQISLHDSAPCHYIDKMTACTEIDHVNQHLITLFTVNASALYGAKN